MKPPWLICGSEVRAGPGKEHSPLLPGVSDSYLVIQTSCLISEIKVMSLDSFHLRTTAWVSCKVSVSQAAVTLSTLNSL